MMRTRFEYYRFVPGTVIRYTAGGDTIGNGKKYVTSVPSGMADHEVGHLNDGDVAIIVAVADPKRNPRWLIVSENAVGWISNLLGIESVSGMTKRG